MPTPIPPEIPTADWSEVRRILAVRLDNLGDVLMTTPALRALRQSVPGREVTLLTSPGGARLAPFLADVDAVEVAEPPWMPGGSTTPEALAATIQRLREGRFDAAVIFTVYSQNPLPAAMMCWQAGIPRILAHSRENPYQLLTDWVPDPEPQSELRHETRRQLDLVATVGATTEDKRLGFRLRLDDIVETKARLRQAGIDPDRPYIAIHPGASAESRRWPAEHFAALARLLARLPDYPLVFTGDESERPLVDSIRTRLTWPVPSLAGALSLGEMAAAIGGARLLIANNTGPVHIAAALGTPVVDLYALTNPQHAPWQVENRVLYHDVPCRFCYRSTCPQGHHDCLRLLDPERVAAAARELLAGAERWPPAPPANKE